MKHLIYYIRVLVIKFSIYYYNYFYKSYYDILVGNVFLILSIIFNDHFFAFTILTTLFAFFYLRAFGKFLLDVIFGKDFTFQKTNFLYLITLIFITAFLRNLNEKAYHYNLLDKNDFIRLDKSFTNRLVEYIGILFIAIERIGNLDLVVNILNSADDDTNNKDL